MKIKEEKVKELIKTIDAGLCYGLGKPRAGEMCVMHAISVIIEGREYDDAPECVNDDISDFDIALNDQPWSSNKARAKGMKREAVAKLGSTEINGDKWLRDVMSAALVDINAIPIKLKTYLKTSKYLPKPLELYIKHLIDEFEYEKVVPLGKNWSKVIDDIISNFVLLECGQLEDFFDDIQDTGNGRSVVDFLLDLYPKTKTKDKAYKWLSNIAADVCVKHKTEGSKFLYLLD